MDTETVKYRFRTVMIRLRGWVRTVVHGVVIAGFVVGAAIVIQGQSAEAKLRPEFAGYQFEPMFGFAAHEVMLLTGAMIMMVSLGLAYRWMISSRHSSATH